MTADAHVTDGVDEDPAAFTESGGIAFEVDVIRADSYATSGEVVAPDEVVARHLDRELAVTYVVFDSGSEAGFPTLALTDDERKKFIEGLVPVAKQLYSS